MCSLGYIYADEFTRIQGSIELLSKGKPITDEVFFIAKFSVIIASAWNGRILKPTTPHPHSSTLTAVRRLFRTTPQEKISANDLNRLITAANIKMNIGPHKSIHPFTSTHSVCRLVELAFSPAHVSDDNDLWIETGLRNAILFI